ncbi:MAG: response regulator [Sphingomonas fennica]
MDRVRICIVDDSLTMRAMLAEMLGGERGIDVVGVVADTAETYAFLRSVRPQVVAIDLGIGGIAGLTLIDRIAGRLGLPVVVLAAGGGDDPVVAQALRRGAVGWFDRRTVATDTRALVRLLKRAAAMKPRLELREAA